MRIKDLELTPVFDGTFVARRRYFGDHIDPAVHAELFDRDEAAWLPIGCFLIRSADRIVLVDAGLGPELQELPHDMYLVGGQLLGGLHVMGVRPADVTDVVCTHFHADHVGWLFDLEARPVFPAATIWFGTGEWAHFVTGPGEMHEHISAGLRAAENTPRLQAVDSEVTVAPGVRAIPAPGHTPGHICVEVTAAGERALLVGDAITCPIQLIEPTWHSMGDVEPALAARTRSWLWQELERPGTIGTGAHFPQLRFGRVEQRTWCS